MRSNSLIIVQSIFVPYVVSGSAMGVSSYRKVTDVSGRLSEVNRTSMLIACPFNSAR